MELVGASLTNSSPESRSWVTNSMYEERATWLHLDPGVHIYINAPTIPSEAQQSPLLIFYAVPNGNTIQQTLGKRTAMDEDWHYNIQHIAAQMRFLRTRLAPRQLVLSCIANDLKSWPAWRKQHGDRQIPNFIEAVLSCFPKGPMDVALAGHSGGGSFIFGYINMCAAIPPRVVRLSFLDANYGYDAAQHEAKLRSWLDSGSRPSLCVLAYNDSVALLNGKTFVSAQGGTWGKSHEMIRDFSRSYRFTCTTNAGLESFSALDGRLQLLLKENPEGKILHTVLVERNGLIHSMLTGTALEHRGYDYFGPPAYSEWIAAE